MPSSQRLPEVSPRLLSKSLLMLCACASLTFSVWAQQESAEPTPAANAPPSRVLGVLPNYRSGELSDPFTPLSTRRKFYIVYKDSTDYPIFFVAGALAGLGQMTDQHPQFGQGMEGFGKRLGGSVADNLIGNFLTESVMPTLLREDPR